MFTRSASYDALYGFKDYGAAVDALRQVLDSEAPGARTLLDVACGTGRHLELLRGSYAVQGLDINPDLLGVARQRCPSTAARP